MQGRIATIENKLMESVKLFGTVLEKLKEEKKESDPTLPAQRISHNLAEINHEMHELIDEVENYIMSKLYKQ